MQRVITTRDGREWAVLEFCEFADAHRPEWGFLAIAQDGTTRQFGEDRPLREISDEVLVEATELADAFTFDRVAGWVVRARGKPFVVSGGDAPGEHHGEASRFLGPGVLVALTTRGGSIVHVRLDGRRPAMWWTGVIERISVNHDGLLEGSLVAAHESHIQEVTLG